MRAIVAVMGSDRTGIIAKISGVLLEVNANILDIQQTTMQGIFTMIALVDISMCNMDFCDMASKLEEAGSDIGVVVSVWHEDIFNAMHKI